MKISNNFRSTELGVKQRVEYVCGLIRKGMYKTKEMYEIYKTDYNYSQRTFESDLRKAKKYLENQGWRPNKEQRTLNLIDIFYSDGLSCFNIGGVYIVQCVGTVFFKIGKANNIDRRLRSLQVGCPFQLRIVHYIECDNPHVLERALHNKYKDKRMRGEWFSLNETDIRHILNI